MRRTWIIFYDLKCSKSWCIHWRTSTRSSPIVTTHQQRQTWQNFKVLARTRNETIFSNQTTPIGRSLLRSIRRSVHPSVCPAIPIRLHPSEHWCRIDVPLQVLSFCFSFQHPAWSCGITLIPGSSYGFDVSYQSSMSNVNPNVRSGAYATLKTLQKPTSPTAEYVYKPSFMEGKFTGVGVKGKICIYLCVCLCLSLFFLSVCRVSVSLVWGFNSLST